jgi:hypothetical protein
LKEHALWGKLRQVWQQSGDVLIVPAGVAMRRVTFEACELRIVE